jgi:hypothetical protein
VRFLVRSAEHTRLIATARKTAGGREVELMIEDFGASLRVAAAQLAHGANSPFSSRAPGWSGRHFPASPTGANLWLVWRALGNGLVPVIASERRAGCRGCQA